MALCYNTLKAFIAIEILPKRRVRHAEKIRGRTAPPLDFPIFHVVFHAVVREGSSWGFRPPYPPVAMSKVGCQGGLVTSRLGDTIVKSENSHL